MNSEFNPYTELLDIPKAECPPNHYVLLGLDSFESDTARIDDAAGERMAALQELANSEYLDASQKLLNEVSAARRCLLDAQQKIAYDEQLRNRQKRASSGRSRSGKKTQGSGKMLPIGGTAGVLLVLLLVYLLTRDPVGDNNLIIEWPESEREGAALTIDGKEVALPEGDPMYLKVPTGRHRLLFKRTGYSSVPKTVEFARARIRISPVWSKDK